jgi:zinc finger CCCH domain-containing protein 13
MEEEGGSEGESVY